MLLTTVASAHDFVVDGIYYIIDGNEATVTFKGDNYFSGDSYSGDVVIPDYIFFNGTKYNVTSIGEHAFYRCSELTRVIIPNSINSIGDKAFYGCTSLVGTELPNSVTYIGFGAFEDCLNLSNIVIPNSIIHIRGFAFYNTAWYNNQPDGVIYAGLVACNYKYIFHMPNGSKIVLKDGTLSISDYAFGMEEEGKKAIMGLSTDYSPYYALVNIIIPNSVIFIGEGAFLNCHGLTSIEIPKSVTTIGNRAFEGCNNLTNIVIGNSVTNIGNYAFYGSNRLNNVYCYGTTPPVCDNGNAFSNYSATLHVPAASLAAYFTAPCWRNFENIVGDAVAPVSIAINKDNIEMLLGEQLQLTAIVKPDNASNKDVIWISTDTIVATVDNGMVSAIGYGECDIIASCFGMLAFCHISVTNKITLNQQEAMVLPNHIITLTPSSSSEVMPELSVSSSDPTVAAARVMNGKVQVVGIKEGTATITVGSADGTAVPATCLVTVYTEPGDVNMDGFLDVSDVTALISHVLGGHVENFKAENADLNGDGVYDVSDVTSLIALVLNNNG